ncbi:DUF1738 domain-containing protein [Tenacibaculum sp. 190130A14a]|uniref:ArdC family protein n=1 Tax=Tenacibaculum polynesiense TaxID=3137857 RepID=UPI003204096D
MTTIQKFQALDGKEVKRSALEKLVAQAKKENNTEIIYRVSKILNDNPNFTSFKITVKQYATGLNAPRHKGLYKQALSECGRLKKGWRFRNGTVVKAQAKTTKKVKPKKALAGAKPKEGLTASGRLKKGYKYAKGGRVIKATSKKKEVVRPVKTEKPAKNIPLEFLAGLDFIEEEDTDTGLHASVSPDQIYQMITDKLITAIGTSKGKPKLGWDKDFLEKGGYLSPVSFASKNAYRGVNIILLKKGNPFTVFDNPYFLTFKQIQDAKGKLKKGSKGLEVVYFTRLYKFFDAKKKEEFTTYNKQKMLTFLKSKGYDTSHFDFLVETIPILKYYKVFNGSDIENIDFGLERLTDLEKAKLGFVSPSTPHNTDEKNPMAELIIKNFPKDSAKITHGFKGASYNVIKDIVKMPKYEAFYEGVDYYSTLFHEMIHSTGHPKRLNRPFGKKFGDVVYAKEELIAEFGAVFLSAQAGILWKTQKDHADYLKNWQLALQFMQQDNRLLMRAASEAQKAVDYLLQVDENKEPKFYKELQKKKAKPKPNRQQELALNAAIKGLSRPKPKIKVPGNINTDSVAYKRKHLKNKAFEYYTINDIDLSNFLGKLEVKPKESLVITLAGKRGSSKTHFAFKFINVLAQKYKVGHASMEEHPESALYWEKADMYFNEVAERNLSNPDIESIDQLDKLIQENDVIVIDSFAKLKELDSKFEIDKDLRKKYDGKLFFIIFQQTADGKMRGGSKSGFDGDCIFFTEKTNHYKTNFIYTDKNRYQNKPLDELKYNIYSGKLDPIVSEEIITEDSVMQEVEF